MEALKKKILTDGAAYGSEIVKVDSFINHQIDVAFLNEIGKEFARIFSDVEITKIITIESSGIAIAVIAAQYFNNVPVVFAKKSESRNLDPDKYHGEVYSFTKQKVYPIMISKKYISPNDKILIIDDFLANGKAALALNNLCEQAGATVQGIGIVIEKGFQPGGKLLREINNIRVESLAIIDNIDNGVITFRD
ncbi:xanthine phosphoribosyltransferase [Anaerotignum sp. MSJ-24]|uniref:xanthine phosphoribosyltransferase n=1 Tax=Anaerotignum sp. MSJ-24 TaxID=2841521 RepID=UPI001C102F7D|nr:xanthine phosphoribosyltransferase [Anaerotignum sp. MSJ-24]MBU5464385.1 xanthine phosphoribosyltransferase [Anaerotignum sp. MSJ-24]